jgi:hypothetical protein
MYKNAKHIEEFFQEVSAQIIDSNDTHNMENIVFMHFEIDHNVTCKLEIM